MIGALVRHWPNRSGGVALITILLIVVIATVLGVSMTNDQHFAINRAQTFHSQSLVRQYALGGEELARQILYQDFIDAPETDHLSEAWAADDLRFEFEEGEIELKITDLQGLININSLLTEANNAQEARRRVQAIFTEQNVDTSFVDRIRDWIDENNGVTGVGAEDFDYLGLERPYRTANQMMLDASELRLILDMDDETFGLVSPFLSTIANPDVEVNVNTAPPIVLQAIVPGLDRATADGIALERDSGVPFEAVNAFSGDDRLPSSNGGNGVREEALSVQSSFFQVSVRARYQDRFGYLTSVIQRDRTDGTIRVIYRDLSKKIQPFIVEESDNG